jgi:hypothetical protein
MSRRRLIHSIVSCRAFSGSVRASIWCLTRSNCGSSRSRSSTTPRRVRDSEISRASTEVHSISVQSESAASGDQKRTVRSASRRPSSIFATKLWPKSMSISHSHGSIFSVSSSAARAWTNCLSFVLWERKTFIGLTICQSRYRDAQLKERFPRNVLSKVPSPLFGQSAGQVVSALRFQPSLEKGIQA